MQQSDCSLSEERREEGEEVSFSNSDHVLSLLPVAWLGPDFSSAKLEIPEEGSHGPGPGDQGEMRASE